MHRKLSQDQVARMRGLLHMEYTTGELARELQCPLSYIYAAILQGFPGRRDVRGRWLVVGDEFSKWYRELMLQQRRSLDTDEVYCLRCRRVTVMPAEREVKPLHNKKLEMVQSHCPQCGAVVNRIRRMEVSHEEA